MQESTLFKLALSLSLIGLLILLFFSEKGNEDLIKIEDALKSPIDQKVKIQGEVTALTETPGLILINLRDNTGEIKAILFKEEEIMLQKGFKIELVGAVKEYQGEKEIEISSIERI